MTNALFLVTAVALLTFSIRQIVGGRLNRVLVTVVATSVYLFAMWIPATLQASGAIEGKLTAVGFALTPTAPEIDRYAAMWSLELAVIAASEFVAWRVLLLRTDPNVVVASEAQWRRVAHVLLLVGFVAFLALPGGSLDERGGGGQGLVVLFQTFLVIGLAVLAYFRCFSDLRYLAVLGVGVILLVLGGVRSPLLVILCAAVASAAARGTFRSYRRVTGLVAAVMVFALLASLMSAFRANTTRQYGFTTSEVVSDVFANPWTAPYEAGLDTFEGYRFSEQVADREPARPEELANVVLTLVPRAVWPEKPSSLAVDLSAKYLNYGASGQFLSTVGYLRLLTGSYAGGLVLLSVLTMAAAALSRRTFGSLWFAVILTVTVRFFIGGSSFDLYYGLVLCIPLVMALSYVRTTAKKSPKAGPGRDSSGKLPNPLGRATDVQPVVGAVARYERTCTHDHPVADHNPSQHYRSRRNS